MYNTASLKQQSWPSDTALGCKTSYPQRYNNKNKVFPETMSHIQWKENSPYFKWIYLFSSAILILKFEKLNLEMGNTKPWLNFL